MIEVENIVAGYTQEVDILKGISLHAAPGEIVSLLGPNGCGKSTLLKTIAGYLRPRSGQVRIAGAEVSALPAHAKVRQCALGFVPQTDNVFAALSVRENMQVGGHFLDPAASRKRIAELCELYPILAQKAQAPAAALSGGERQLLALARALMPRPSMLLLDEPSAGLSPRMLLEVFDAIQTIRSREQVTILMVEQNAMEALRISNRAYILSMGTVALSGEAGKLMDDPQVRELYLGGRAA